MVSEQGRNDQPCARRLINARGRRRLSRLLWRKVYCGASHSNFSDGYERNVWQSVCTDPCPALDVTAMDAFGRDSLWTRTQKAAAQTAREHTQHHVCWGVCRYIASFTRHNSDAMTRNRVFIPKKVRIARLYSIIDFISQNWIHFLELRLFVTLFKIATIFPNCDFIS